MVFELWFQSDQAEENSGSVGGKLGGNLLFLGLGSATEEEGLLGESRISSDRRALAS